MEKHKWLLYLYSLIALIEIFGEAIENHTAIGIFKPLLMFPLIAYAAINLSGTIQKLLIVSLFFSWSGDVNLLFVSINENFFLVGLASFLIAHILYIVIFNKEIKRNQYLTHTSFVYKIIVLILFSSFYSFLMLYLYPTLGEFSIPVLVYGLVICLMGIFASLRLNKVSSQSFLLVLFGSLIFILSDSTIAVNKFVFSGNLAFAQTLIMITYTISQLLIIQGITKSNLK